MALADARRLDGLPCPVLPVGPPYRCGDLVDWLGLAFALPPGDPRLEDIFMGGDADTPPLDNLVGAVRYWDEHPEWMDFIDPSAPNHHDKLVERAIYLERWEAYLPGGARVLDLGGGVGRFAAWLLERDCQVELVDPDLRSLWRALSMAVQGSGAIDLHWATGETLPELAPVDVVVACEVLCYVEDPALVLEKIRRVLKPGGVLLASVEARWGWAMAPDVHEGTIDAFLGDGVVHQPGDRWVRTYTEDRLRRLLEDWEILELWPTHYALSGPFEMIAGELDVDEALALEARLRAHPVSGPLNRAFAVVARPR
ncbi:MAG: class I SAM-dependent methyltransferase [Oligoflexia bacterium]|nr:class I SAM-dependent methyltransferase [Oligoflexia bacterium]